MKNKQNDSEEPSQSDLSHTSSRVQLLTAAERRLSQITVEGLPTNDVSSCVMERLTSYPMDDQRWALTRKKIGLNSKSLETAAKKEKQAKIYDENLTFIRTFKMKECIRYEAKPGANEERCYCGQKSFEHFLEQFEEKNKKINLMDSMGDERAAVRLGRNDGVLPSNRYANISTAKEAPYVVNLHEELELDDTDTAGQMLNEHLKAIETFNDNNVNNPHSIFSTIQQEDKSAFSTKNSTWKAVDCIKEFPSNAYGEIEFLNESIGSNKPAKYLRMSDSTDMPRVLNLLVKYWRLAETGKPNLVLSVTGGAKNFKLDGNRKAIFNAGLIKAVRSTNAWIITGGTNVGVMRSVGEAVNKGQFILKIKRKLATGEVKLHMARGIKCIAVAPWGYIKGSSKLINNNPSQFFSTKYKVDDTINKYENISLNGDHTHFIFVDTGFRNVYCGADKFRTRLEEAIMAEEPQGLGVPVVLLILEGGLNSIRKCSMALKRRVPVVVVAGTGRAADLIAYAVSVTHETNGGQLVMRKVHRQQLELRVEASMQDYDEKTRKIITELVIECCHRSSLITIFDIDSNEAMDKYILYALLKGDGLTESSLMDQLHLSLLWNRPDIAETDIFPARTCWTTEILENLTTKILLEEKVEFLRLFAMNGFVLREYLTVGNLRHLYNAGFDVTKHVAIMFQRITQSQAIYLKHVQCLFKLLLGHHEDILYEKDSPNAEPKHSAHTFEDPNHELLLWAVLSERATLARYLWERCESPLLNAVLSSALYRALYRQVEATNTEQRQKYAKLTLQFERLAVQLSEECYSDDPMNAVGLVERRNSRWGNMDCLDLALAGNEMNFIASSCCQTSIDLSWKRGMIKASTLTTILTIVMPFLVWTQFFKFQKLGDDGGELSPWQKLVVFYKSPMTKFYSHSIAFIGFLLLYSYVVLFDFSFQLSTSELCLLGWIGTYVIENINEFLKEQAETLSGKWTKWWSSVWNRFDLVSVTFAVLALLLRLNRDTFTFGRIAYAFNTTVFFCRVLRIYHVHYSLGPKLVIFYRMMSEVLVFMALLVIFILGYGLAAQSLLKPSPIRNFTQETLYDTIKQVFLTPYWQMYGELLLDEVQGVDVDVCHSGGVGLAPVCENPKDYTWAVQFMLIFYLIIGNIMLLNMLIAIFTYVFDEVQENSMEIWKFERYRLLREYDSKPGLVAPFFVLEHLFRFFKWICKRLFKSKVENLNDFMSASLITLRIFEKEAVATFLAKLQHGQDASLENKVALISEKIHMIAKFIEQEKEMRQIEAELQYNEQNTDASTIECQQVSVMSTTTGTPRMLPATEQKMPVSATEAVQMLQEIANVKTEHVTEQDDNLDSLSVAEKLCSNFAPFDTKRRVHAEKRLHSGQNSKVQTLTKICSTRDEKPKSSKSRVLQIRQGSESGSEVDEPVFFQRSQGTNKHLTKRLSNEPNVSSSRTTSKNLRKQNGRVGSSLSRESFVLSSARQDLAAIVTLNRRVDDIATTLFETQRDVRELLDLVKNTYNSKTGSSVSKDNNVKIAF